MIINHIRKLWLSISYGVVTVIWKPGFNKKHKDRKRLAKQNKAAKAKKNNNEKFIKNLSNCHLSTDQTNILSRGLRFIPSRQTKADCVRKQPLSDFDQFARRMRLGYL